MTSWAQRPHSINPDRQRSGRSRHETETSACRGEWRREAHRPRKRARPSVCRRERARDERPPPQIGLGSFKTSEAFLFLKTVERSGVAARRGTLDKLRSYTSQLRHWLRAVQGRG